MATWILIIFVRIGSLSGINSIAIHSIPDFADKGDCLKAGQQIQQYIGSEIKSSDRSIMYECVKQKGEEAP